jgi:hypothetical protein
MPSQPLAPWQQEDAARVQTLFTAWQAGQRALGLPYSRAWACDQLQFGQSALSQYLHGKVPLNLTVAAKFSRLLGVSIEDFSPSLATAAREFAGVTGIPTDAALYPLSTEARKSVDAEEWRLVLAFRAASKQSQDLLLALAMQLHQTRRDGLSPTSDTPVIEYSKP